jgi:hypothetical protein
MKKYFYVFLLTAFICFSSKHVFAQGCVAVKNMSSTALNWGDNARGLQLSVNYRYFRSYKHFRGSHEEANRVAEGTEVINNDNSINLGASYTFNNRFSAAIFVPVIFIDRSSLYEHLGNSAAQNPDHLRFHTQSQGIGDIRVVGYYNSLPSNEKASLVLGYGVKLPTGNYHVKDDFHVKQGDEIVTEERYVDQSIQLGDGGLGLITEIDFSHKIAGKFSGYVNAMYMFNPRNTNGVKRSNNPSTYPVLRDNGGGNYVIDRQVEIPLSNEMSVPDQYMLRFGGRVATHNFQASLGGRLECIPSKDIMGESDGFRRPGYIFSAEPSLAYSYGAHTLGVNVPLALYRNRTRSQIDIARGNSITTGDPNIGDAAFADWLLSVSYAYRLNR